MNRKVIPFIGKSKFTTELKDLVHTLSQSNTSVLLQGEKGTGKRLFAQHLHIDAADDFGYLYEVNCRSFSAQQITYAFNTVNKLVAYEQRITLYVSHVDELSLPLQMEFLKFIDATFKKGLNLKLVCSVENLLEESVNDGTFSTDLYYRLNAIVLNMLPLRQRQEDILPIATEYLASFAKKSGSKIKGFTDDCKQKMLSYQWSGNIDQLINGIQRAFIVGKEPLITSNDLGITQNESFFGEFESILQDKSLKVATDTFKREYVKRILEECQWNQTKAAKILDIQRTYVIRLMNELDIHRK